MSLTPNRLQRNAIGLIAVAGMAAVLMSPSLGLYFNWGAMAIATGPIGPLVFLAAMLASLPTAYCYASVAREIPSAGQAYTWLWRAIGARVGFWTGVVFAVFYMTTVWLVLVMFSLFFHDFLAYFGLQGGLAANVAGVLIALGFVAWVSYGEIKFNSKVALGFLAFETLTVFGLGLVIFFHQASSGQLTLTPFNPSAATAGLSGFRGALIFGVLAFIGFDYAAVLAEEAKTPRSNVPIAVILAVTFVGLFWVVTSYFLSMAVPMSQVQGYVNSGLTPVTPIAEKFLGGGSIIVIITGMTACLGNLVVAAPSAARVLYAMGRDGTLPAVLGKTDRRTQVPRNALHVVFAVGGVFAIGMGLVQGNFFNAFAWFGTLSALIALSVYSMVTIATGAFFWRFERARFNVLKHFVVPAAALLINLYLLWTSFISQLWNQPFATGSSILYFGIAVWVAAVLYTVWLSIRNPALVRRTAIGLEVDEPIPTLSGS